MSPHPQLVYPARVGLDPVSEDHDIIHRDQDSAVTKNVLGLCPKTIFEFDWNHCPTLFSPYVAAYPPGRVHRAVPSDQNR